ncbi:hypothetical protein J0X14_17830 [Muricauda sp. CAU 1633]|uniref:hypothetical protein n=1 Tax=Allomuricauda sp. CAU 1633 TaxID=2816036 RepID=UPI001A8E4703|nr:hypothetical protein [Muricauda sp. CAU 1633]MBO0324174.1 hypothetical protein [Muricauda sp. CAU 1633]
MNKIFPSLFIMFFIIACKTKGNDFAGPALSYKESEIQKRLYLQDSVQSKSYKFKSFSDDDREL